MLRRSWRSSILTVAVVFLLTVVLAACQSAPAQAPATESAAPAAETAATEAPATEATEAAPTEAVTEAATEAAPESTEAAATEAAATDAQAAGGAVSFQIVPDGTEARFMINEVLMGQDKTVVGTTPSVTGEITVDPANPAAVQIGEIRVDASGLTTDDDRRTRQLRNNILKFGTPQYQFIVFKPTAIEGMPASVAVGEPITFKVTGDLTILDKTAPVTFEMTVTPESTELLKGTGTATVRYADFGISIPSVPFVAGVSDEVQLEVDFTAQAAS